VTELSTTALLRVVAGDGVRAALANALQGGPPVAPVPEAEPDRRQVLDMLHAAEPVEHPDTAAVVATSGSTGKPKGVVLSRSAIAASVAATHARLGGAGDWVLALPTHYVAGLMVLARTVLAQTTLHVLPTDLAGLSDTVETMSGRRYLSLVPTQLFRACADEHLSRALTQFDAVLLGGAAAEPTLLEEARRRGIRVVTTYGMSETCGGCVYDGVPLDGVEVDLEADSGRVLLAGPVLFSGYRLRPDLTQAALGSGRLRTADRGRWCFGVNVDLAAVERAARACQTLAGAEVAVVGVPDPEWGTRVVAVMAGAGSATELRSCLQRTLPPHAVPRHVAKLTALPRTSGGKIDRQRLVQLVAAEELRREA